MFTSTVRGIVRHIFPFEKYIEKLLEHRDKDRKIGYVHKVQTVILSS